jgi:molybdopterin/thiamine biosynthesis adenylyltransferase
LHRLKRTVEVFEAADGQVYLMRGGAEAAAVIDAPTEAARRLLARLRDGATEAELRAELAGAEPAVGAGDVRAAIADLGAHGVLEHPGDRDARQLDPESLERFDRQLAYFADVRPGEASRMQAALAGCHVAIVGVGGLGSWAAAALACAGVGTLTLVDDDSVELSNLNRQFIYRRRDVGRSKVRAAAEALRAFNPACEVRERARRVRGPSDVAEIAAGADLIVDTADWPPYDIGRWIDEAAQALRTPWIAAAQFPPFVRIGPLYIPGVTACLECQERAGRAAYPLYDELADFRRTRESYAATLGPASGLVGSALAMEAMHLLAGVCTPATAGAAAILDLRTLETRLEPVARDPECTRCG